jgi:hypothetical protein
MKRNIKKFNNFSRVNEQDTDLPPRVYGQGSTPEAELIEMINQLVDDIRKSNPKDQDSYEEIKSDIKSKTDMIRRHRSYGDLRNGIHWQDEVIKLVDFSNDIRSAVSELTNKANKKGFR